MIQKIYICLFFINVLVFSLIAFASPGNANEIALSGHGKGRATLKANDHAPIGVMGNHMHRKGEWMLSYRFMHMNMRDSADGNTDKSPIEITTSVPNRFFGIPGQPPTLRVAPVEMHTNMHMFGAMYAPTDTLTLMAMVPYLEKEMDHLTFQGGAGITILDEFTTKTEGWGDARLSSLIHLYKDSMHHIHLNAGISLPTGSIDEEDDVLAPTGARPRLRVPYAMQLGSGTYDLLPGITYNGFYGPWSWGAQYNATIHLGENTENYTWGDKHQITTWGSYLWTQTLSTSLRLKAETQENIHGIDDQILTPVQTADPENYGGERLSLSLGINHVIPSGIFQDHRFSIEATAPLSQDLNVPQLKSDHAIVLGWEISF